MFYLRWVRKKIRKSFCFIQLLPPCWVLTFLPWETWRWKSPCGRHGLKWSVHNSCPWVIFIVLLILCTKDIYHLRCCRKYISFARTQAKLPVSDVRWVKEASYYESGYNLHLKDPISSPCGHLHVREEARSVLKHISDPIAPFSKSL